jgi:hypothetical protein
MYQYMAKEAYAHGKRGLCTWALFVHGVSSVVARRVIAIFWQKRPMYMAKEAYAHGKRGVCTWQKRPLHMAKDALYVAQEAYVCGIMMIVATPP